MVLTLKGRSAPPNPNIFPPSPPSDSGSTLLSSAERLRQLPDSDIFKERAEPPVNDGGKQQAMLCPYFLKNPHLVPEHSLCRLKGFENIWLLRRHIERDHKLALQSDLVGETELEEFEQIWKHIFTNHQGNIPHPRLCSREFLRKQQNLRVMEMYETYILAQLNDEPGTAARLGRIFDGFRQRFSPRAFGYFFLPETRPALPQSKVLAPKERQSEECGTHPETRKTAITETMPETTKDWASESIDTNSDTPADDGPMRAPPNTFRSFFLAINTESVEEVMKEFQRIVDREDWEFPEDDRDSTTDNSTPTECAQHETTDAGDETTQASGSSSRLSASYSTGMSSSRSGNGKRKSTGAGRDDNNGGGGKRRKSIPPDDRESTSHLKRLSCPYLKRYPAEQSKSNSCSNPPGFLDVNRVKEHIYRVHPPCDECPRCFVEFESLGDLQSHLASEERCEKVTKEGVTEKQSITHDQEKKLKSKKDTRTLSREERWRKVYRLIFNLAEDDETPSPYYEQPKGYLDRYYSFRDRRLPQLVREELRRIGQALLTDMLLEVMRRCNTNLSSEFQEMEASNAWEDEAVVELNATVQEEQSTIPEASQQQETEESETQPEQQSDELPSAQTTGFNAQSMGGNEWSTDTNAESFEALMQRYGHDMDNMGEFSQFHFPDHQE